MKVLVISHIYPSAANEVAGIFVHGQVKALVAKGVQVRVVSPVPWAPFPINRVTSKWRAYGRVPESSSWEGIEVFYPRYMAFPRAWLFATSGRRMYRGIRKTVAEVHRQFPFDLLHAHVALPSGYAAALLAQDFGKPLIVTIHGQDLQHTIYRDPDCREAVGSVLQRATRIIVVSRKLHDLAVEHFDARHKLVVIPNGVDPQEVARAQAAASTPCTDGSVILSVSNLEPAKGIDLNIYAVGRLRERHPRLEYWVVGSGPEENKLRALVAQLGLEKQVRFFGPQSHGEALRYMARCSVFSLPSWNEGFGVAYIEAMALAKPVIGCQGEGPKDFVEHGKTGMLVTPRDVNSLVEALDFLLSHRDAARAMGERAREVVLQNYTWEKNAEMTIEVYREVLGDTERLSSCKKQHGANSG